MDGWMALWEEDATGKVEEARLPLHNQIAWMQCSWMTGFVGGCNSKWLK